MSEIGPINVRSRLRCLMISWPAANGINDSSAAPISTEQPLGTNRSIACAIVTTFPITTESPKAFRDYFGEPAMVSENQPQDRSAERLRIRIVCPPNKMI